MSEGKRPGGLTALAVINFIFGGFNAIYVLMLAGFAAVLNAGAASADANQDAKTREIIRAWEENAGLLYVLILLSAASATLLIASGVGYLKQKKFLGRTLGNVYAVLAIVATVVEALLTPAVAGGGFNLGTIVGLIYPVLTLLLLNTTFKEDFIR